jgi:hypothetical protein
VGSDQQPVNRVVLVFGVLDVREPLRGQSWPLQCSTSDHLLATAGERHSQLPFT